MSVREVTGPCLLESPLAFETEPSEDLAEIRYRIRRKVWFIPAGVTVEIEEEHP